MKRSKFRLDFKTILKTLYKKGSKTDPKNYRPVSLLPLVSKVIEKFVHNQTEIFWSKNRALYKYQSEFRKSFSTNSCLTLLANSVTPNATIPIQYCFLQDHNRCIGARCTLLCNCFLLLTLSKFLSNEILADNSLMKESCKNNYDFQVSVNYHKT